VYVLSVCCWWFVSMASYTDWASLYKRTYCRNRRVVCAV